MNRLLCAVVAGLIVHFLAFADHNGNGQMDAGESYADGRYELYRTAADGAVDMTVVQYPPGVPFVLALEDGDQVVAVSGCGSWAVDTSQATTGVPVTCRAVFLPLIGAALGLAGGGG